jgi:hypothetical protein
MSILQRSRRNGDKSIYHKSTVNHLKDECKSLGIKDYSNKKRDELIAMIEKYIEEKSINEPLIREEVRNDLFKKHLENIGVTREMLEIAIAGR